MFSQTPHNAPTQHSKTPPKRAAFLTFVLLGGVAASSALFTGGCASSGATAAARNADGVNLYAAGNYDQAIGVFQEALELNPRSAEAYYNLGAAYQRKGSATGDVNLLTQAENAYWAALELDAAPETIVCCYRGIATSATTRGDVDGALQTLQDWSERNPDSIEPKLEIAYFLEAQDRDDDAYAVLEEVAKAAPSDYRAFYKMGILQERAGNVEEALNQTAIAGRLNPTDSTVAKRTTALRTQLASVQRGGSLDEADAVPGETKLVSSTSAQATETTETSQNADSSGDDSTPKTPIAPESPVLPESLDSPGATNAPTVKLGKDEIVLFSAPQISGISTPNERSVAASDDSIRWVSATSAQGSASDAAETRVGNAANGPLPDGTGLPNDAVFVAQNVETSQPKDAIDSAQGTKTEPTTSVVPVASSKSTPKQPNRKRTELNSGPPTLRAGSLF